MKDIGFIGLGIMGQPMVKNLLAANFHPFVYDINHNQALMVESLGAHICDSPTDLALKSQIIFIMLPTNQIIDDLFFSPTGIINVIKPGSIVICTSSVSLSLITKMAKALAKKQIALLDAPVSGGEVGAIEGTLSFMVGGQAEVLKESRELFEVLGHSTVLIGDVGAGTIAKLANQILVNTTIAALSEAIFLASEFQIDTAKMVEAISQGLASSAVLEQKAPMMLQRNFQAGGRIDINQKDMANVLAASRDLQIALPLSEQVHSYFDRLTSEGLAHEDHSALLKYYELSTPPKGATDD